LLVSVWVSFIPTTLLLTPSRYWNSVFDTDPFAILVASILAPAFILVLLILVNVLFNAFIVLLVRVFISFIPTTDEFIPSKYWNSVLDIDPFAILVAFIDAFDLIFESVKLLIVLLSALIVLFDKVWLWDSKTNVSFPNKRGNDTVLSLVNSLTPII